VTFSIPIKFTLLAIQQHGNSETPVYSMLYSFNSYCHLKIEDSGSTGK
jgi:hypothetical protein